MPKMTAKYKFALATLHHHNGNMALPFDQRIVIDYNDQEVLYSALQEAGYFWDSKKKQWEYHEPEAANDPTPMIMIRVWADKEIVEEAEQELRAALTKHLATKDWSLLERSPVYGCRPPKQLEARIYLKFLPNWGNGQSAFSHWATPKKSNQRRKQ